MQTFGDERIVPKVSRDLTVGTHMRSRSHVPLATLGLLAACLLGSHAFAANANHCSDRNVSFDGTKPLHYANVIGPQGSRIYLRTQVPARCPASDESVCRSSAFAEPGDAVAVARTCGAWAYVQHIGKEKISVGWIARDDLQDRHALLPVDDGEPGRRKRPDAWPAPATIRVKLTKGRGIPVCEAYLQRLNQTVFHEPAFCGIPENAQVPGFLDLQRKTLAAAVVNQLFVKAWNISRDTGPGNEMVTPPAGKEDLVGELLINGMIGETFKRLTDKDNISAWAYEPRVDIENDGKPENVTIWRGLPPVWLTNRFQLLHACGVSSLSGFGVEGERTIPFILHEASDAIDVGQTNAVFGVQGMSQAVPPLPGIQSKLAYLPLGISADAFVYRGKSYFSAFITEHTNEVTSGRLDPVEAGHLSVYFDQAGVTQEICRYENTDALRHWGEL